MSVAEPVIEVIRIARDRSSAPPNISRHPPQLSIHTPMKMLAAAATNRLIVSP